MKKIITVILTGIVMLMSFTLYGCDTKSYAYNKIMAKDETDGQFYYYYYDKNLEGYAIVGDMEENNPEVMYLPAYYKGKEVKRIFYTTAVGGFGMLTKTFGPSFQNVKKLYVPFALTKHYAMNIDYIKIFIVDEIYYSGTSYDSDNNFCYLLFYEINHFQQNQTYYFTSALYSEFLSVAKKNYADPRFHTWEEYCDKTVVSYHNTSINSIDATILFYKANTVFCFNYESSPNAGVFFVDNFDYGTTINDTPYYPIRDGYNFTGWYKEPECINKWDFEADTLPIVEYDKDGSPTEFVETKLYAGWQKI